MLEPGTCRQLARYNAWANARLFEAALAMPDTLYRRSVGVFFGSLHGTLNHLLATDRIWLKRITGQGDAPDRVDTLLFDDRQELLAARLAEDARLLGVVDALAADALGRDVVYATTKGVPYRQPLGDILLHLFNHQTHHRGQAHACCSILTGAEPPTLDLLAFQRGVPAPTLRPSAG